MKALMKRIVLKAKKALKKFPVIIALHYYVRHSIRYYITNDHVQLSYGEIAVFDVVERFNSDYLPIADGEGVEIFHFEPNPKYFDMLLKTAASYQSRNFINVFNIGLSDEEGALA